jgi:hypothetical protein
MESAWGGVGMVTLVGLAVGLALTVVVGGALLMLAVRWIGGFRPGYARSCGVALLGLVLGTLLQLALAYLVRATVMPYLGGGLALSVVLLFAGIAISVGVTAVLVRVLLPKPDGSLLSLGRALGASAVAGAMGLAIYALVVGVMLAMVGGLGGWH